MASSGCLFALETAYFLHPDDSFVYQNLKYSLLRDEPFSDCINRCPSEEFMHSHNLRERLFDRELSEFERHRKN